MKKINIICLLLLVELLGYGQPLPPSTPEGNPVPIDHLGLGLLAFIVLLFLGIYFMKKRQNTQQQNFH